MRDFQAPGRSAVLSTNGMAATSHPRASLVAIDTLRSGGNAIDAAVAAAAVLAVVEPHMTGIGGDCFALYAQRGDNEIISINGSGRAPSKLSLDRALSDSHDASGIDQSSPHSVTIPGAVDTWCRLVRDYGQKDIAEILRPAIEIAENGYPVHARVARDWATEVTRLSRDPNAAAAFLCNGSPPVEGDLHRQPALARTLRNVAAKGRAGFYEGETAEIMASYLRNFGGVHLAQDFAENSPTYTNVIKSKYRDVDICQCPPNTQGVTALQFINILEGFDLQTMHPLDPEWLHLEIEAGRLAYRDRDLFLADPEMAEVPIAQLLSKKYGEALRKLIHRNAAMRSIPSVSYPETHTVYLSVIDKDRNSVSFINSLFEPFGSGIFCPTTGVMFQNRGSLFSLKSDHPNCIAPGKRPLHTIIPGMAIKDGRVIMSFGIMGGHYQPFGHANFVTAVYGFGLDPQTALDLPRVGHNGVLVEAEVGIPSSAIDVLTGKGHTVVQAPDPHGGGQAIAIDWSRGILIGASDPRKDGCAIGY